MRKKLTTVSICALLVAAYPQTAPAQDDGATLPFKTERPRLVFSKAQLPVIRVRCERAYKGEYRKMVAWADQEARAVLSDDFSKAWRETIGMRARPWAKNRAIQKLYFARFQTFGLLWHLTGEKRYAEAGKRVVSSLFELVTGTVRLGLAGGRAIDCAAGYDLFYNAWTPEERKAHGKALFDLFKRLQGNMHSYHGFGAPASVLVALCGTDVEPEVVTEQLADAQRWAKSYYLRGFSLISRNRGGWNEGIFCMCMSKAHEIPFWWRWQNATGGDFFETNPTFSGMGNWLVYNVMDWTRKNANKYRVPTPHVNGYVHLHAVDVCSALSRDPVGTWLTRRLGQDKADTPDLLWRKILLFPPDLQAVHPKELPETAIFEGWGWVSMRSGWDAGSVFAHFSSGMKGQGEPAHLDNNRFIIYHKGLLAVDGVKPVASEKFPDTYDRMTLAHNTLTVYDPDEKIWGRSMYVYTHVHGKPFAVNDGGQTFRKDCFLDKIYNVRGPSKMVKQGDIVAYETSPLYDYVCGDATKSYSAHKMKHFTRQLVFLKPDVFVVFDRVVSTKKGYRKRWHLQFFTEPVIEETAVRADYEGGRLWCETLLPEKATLRKVQGARIEQLDGAYKLPKVWEKYDNKAWRLDVGPAEPQTEDLFLHVLQAVDAGKPRTFAATTVRKGDKIGVRVTRGGRTFEVLFAKTGKPAGSVTISEKSRQLVSQELAEKLVDSYAQWKDDPRFKMWMTDERFRYLIPKGDRERFKEEKSVGK